MSAPPAARPTPASYDVMHNLPTRERMLQLMRRAIYPVVVVTAPASEPTSEPAEQVADLLDGKVHKKESLDAGSAQDAAAQGDAHEAETGTGADVSKMTKSETETAGLEKLRGPPPVTHSMTVSSLTTVSMNPVVVVSMNVKVPSATLDAVRANDGYFVAHFLRGTSKAAAFAAFFADPIRSAPGRNLWRHLRAVHSLFTTIGGGVQPEQGDKVAQSPQPPTFPGYSSDEIMATLSCRLLPDKQLAVADHVVVCAEVLSVKIDKGWTFPGTVMGYGEQLYRTRPGIVGSWTPTSTKAERAEQHKADTGAFEAVATSESLPVGDGLERR